MPGMGRIVSEDSMTNHMALSQPKALARHARIVLAVDFARRLTS